MSCLLRHVVAIVEVANEVATNMSFKKSSQVCLLHIINSVLRMYQTMDLPQLRLEYPEEKLSPNMADKYACETCADKV